MAPDPGSHFNRWRGYALSTLVGLVSALAASWIGLPLPWFLGPMIGNTLAAVLTVPVAAPVFLRPIAFPVLGVMLGSAFLPELLGQAGDWLSTILIVPIFVILAGASTYAYFRVLGRFDPVTAFFSAMPGGLNEMVLQGEAEGGDVRRIALAHASRILIVVVSVGIVYSQGFGVTTAEMEQPFTAFSDLSQSDWFWLTLCAVVGSPLGRLLRLPAGAMMGPLLVSGVLHLVGTVSLGPPTYLSLAAQFVLGTSVGCRFAGTPPMEVIRNLILGAGASVIMLAAALVCAILVAWTSDISAHQAFLAYSPGGMMEMSLLALAMGQTIAYVSLAHVVRFTVVLLIAPGIFRMFQKRQ